MNLVQNYFEGNGEKLVPQNSSPLRLNDDGVYLVTEGNINLFGMEVLPDGEMGARHYIMSLKEGDLFTGFTEDLARYPMALLVAGNPDTEVRKVSRSVFSELIGSDVSTVVCSMLEAWFSRLIYKIYEPFQIMEYQEPEAGFIGTVYSDVPLMSKQRLLWVEHRIGSSLVFNCQDSIIGGELIFPISELVYINTLENSEISCFTTTDLFEKGVLWSNIDKLFLVILNKLVKLKEHYLGSEKKRLIKIKELKDTSLKKGVSRLVNIFHFGSRKVFPEHENGDDPVLSACRIIGEYLKLDFVLPPEMEEGIGVKERLEEISRASRVKVRKVLLDLEWWKRDNGPLLVFNKESGNPVALIPKSPYKYYYRDVITGVKGVVDKDYGAELEDFGYFFYRPLPERPLSWVDLIKFGTFRNSRDFFMVIGVGVAGALLGLINPYLTGKLFDSVIPAASMGELNQMIYILISTAIGISMFELTRSITILRFEGKMDRDLQAALWDRLLALPVPFFRKYSAGDLANRSLGIGRIRKILSGIALNSILSGIFSLFYCLQLFYYNVELAFIGFGLGVLIMVVSVGLGYIFMRFQLPLLEIEGKISGMVLQFINGISKLRITGMEDYAFQFWADKFARKKELAFKAGLAQCSLRTFNSVITVFASMLIFGFIVKGIDRTLFSVGDFAAYFSAYGQYQNALLQMGIYLTSSLTMIPIYRRLKPIITNLPEVNDTKIKPKKLKGNVKVYSINFSYNDEGPQIVKNLSMDIGSGDFVAITGQSGSGKSTMVRLLLGFETPDSGSIFYDDLDLATVDIGGIRKQIGVVLQNSSIMQGSILENILGATNLTEKDAWKAAEMVGVAEDIDNMPMKMQTVLTFGGGTLSGGQRQRILIARALVKKPGIIIFDEATSALDNRTQKIVSDSLERLNITRIVIAHRLSTIKGADKIYFMDKGAILEKGSFEELMALNGQFASLAGRQLI